MQFLHEVGQELARRADGSEAVRAELCEAGRRWSLIALGLEPWDDALEVKIAVRYTVKY